MMNIRYAPGDAWAVAAGGSCVVVSGDTTPQLIADLHAALGEGADLTRILDAFTSAFGASLSALPPFAAVFAEGDGVRVAVRGALTVEADAPGSAHEFSGAGVTTWSERVIADVVRLQVRVSDAPDAAYPLADGAAAVSAVLLERAGAVPRDVEVLAPASAASPEPADLLPAADPAPTAGPAPEAPQETLLPRETTVLPEATATTTSGLIDAVPNVTTGYDDLWGATVMRSVEDAAVRIEDEPAAGDAASAPPVPPIPAAPPAPSSGDHDGQTISLAQLRAMRGESQPTVDVSIPPLAAARPAAPGRLSVSNGQSVLLDRTVVIGRRPRSTRVAGTDLPHLVAVDSPQQDISRSHVEFRVEGDSILITDLHTTNGTMLVRPGAAPTRLHPGEATVIVAGDVIDLGDGVTVAVEAVS